MDGRWLRPELRGEGSVPTVVQQSNQWGGHRRRAHGVSSHCPQTFCSIGLSRLGTKAQRFEQTQRFLITFRP